MDLTTQLRYADYPCPLGYLRISHDGDRVYTVRILDESGPVQDPAPISDLAASQFSDYFSGRRQTFDFPMALHGTAFQQAVWAALLTIPFGETRTYADIALQLEKPGGARAVGTACKNNPIWIAVPCHRVLGQNRKLTGYAGGLHRKAALLEMEKNEKNPGT